MEKINLDSGFSYGIGVFETMAIVNGKVIFADRHLRRLQKGLAVLGIEEHVEVKQFFRAVEEEHLYGVKKVIVSDENVIVSYSDNPYTKVDYERGFRLEIDKIKRNETSPFTYIKSLNYGDNIVAKKKLKKTAIDEPIFLNTRGELTEGAATNIFFCRGDEIYTPPVDSGLLPGIMREWIMENVPVIEKTLYPEEVNDFDEIFVSNSLMGVMPVTYLGEYSFYKRENATMLTGKYGRELEVL